MARGRAEAERKKEAARTVLSIAGAAAAFLGMFFGLKFGIIVSGLLSIGIYFGLYMLLKPSPKYSAEELEDMPGAEEKQKMLDDADSSLTRLEESAGAIADPKVKRDAEALCSTGRRILKYLTENPEKISLARKFITFYLTSAERLLARYVEFQNTGLRTGEVSEILERTADILPKLNRAFESQFTNLMRGELMDVEADISLLDSFQAMDGTQLKADPVNAAAKKEPEDAARRTASAAGGI
ncbi:MAG: 5-bromo-4-chloroindolyl phosphate hydrolysis family protein [Oscillospiraceae bacterium]|jgi:5-bromo-4-chloroindolyl phosphate hydrolysis protein